MIFHVVIPYFDVFQTHAEVTLAKADGALRQKEDELIKLKETHEALRTELTTVKQDLSVTAERAEILQEDGQVGFTILIIYTVA